MAEDVVQEALCRVLRRWHSFRGECDFKTWMLQIVVNVDRDRRRSRRQLMPMPPDHPSANNDLPADCAAAAELSHRIRMEIDRLPTRQREVALLVFGEGLAAREAAIVLETTEANVHTCLHLARKRIAQMIGTDYAPRPQC
jgi:RNA polymerase sigma-70 factor (ECF subfamily)